MIFVTVGTELAFDRLIRTVDQWARETGRTDVFAQIGQGAWEPSYIQFSHFISPPEFLQRFTSADLIVSHAGMGTILSALQHEKPILVMPRRATLGEHRNEHQLATARRLLDMGKVAVAFDEAELRAQLARVDEFKPLGKISAFAEGSLTSAIREFIFQHAPSARK